MLLLKSRKVSGEFLSMFQNKVVVEGSGMCAPCHCTAPERMELYRPDCNLKLIR